MCRTIIRRSRHGGWRWTLMWGGVVSGRRGMAMTRDGALLAANKARENILTAHKAAARCGPDGTHSVNENGGGHRNGFAAKRLQYGGRHSARHAVG